MEKVHRFDPYKTHQICLVSLTGEYDPYKIEKAARLRHRVPLVKKEKAKMMNLTKNFKFKKTNKFSYFHHGLIN